MTTNMIWARRQAGLSLIELMIAVLIAGLLILGITSLFSNTSNLNRMENGLARLQENGRFAMAMIQQDIKMATATGSIRKTIGEPGRVDRDLALISTVDLATRGNPHGLPGYYSGQPDRYYIPRSYMIRGHRCTGVTCTPAVEAQVPPVGSAAGSRAAGADVLTVSYQRDLGVRVRRGTAMPLQEDGEKILLDAPLEVGPSRLVILNDYQTTIIVSVQETGSTSELTPVGNLSNAANGLSALQGLQGERWAADFDSSFVTVTYYLGLVEDENEPGRLISSLFRDENGAAQEVARGIERLDFVYHVEDAFGNVSIYTADALDAAGAAFQCSKTSPEAVGLVAIDQPICQWRSVRAVDIHLLANTVSDAGMREEPFTYAFLPNGSLAPAGTVQMACDPAFGSCPADAVTVLPSGLPPGRMLRREFRTTAVVRNAAF